MSGRCPARGCDYHVVVMPSRRSAALALAFVIPAPSVGALVSFWLAPGALGLAVYAICKTILYVTPAVWATLVDRERPSLSPLRAGTRARELGIGIAFGLVVGILIVLTWWGLGSAALDVSSFRDVLRDNGLTTPVRFLVAAAWLSIVNALLEEYAFRWFVTTRIAALANRWTVWLAALAFTAHHIIVLARYLPMPALILACAGVFVGGVAWSWMYRRSGSIWPGYVSHAIVDVAIMAVGYVALIA